MILIVIATWFLVGFISSFKVIEIYKKRELYDNYPWNILSSPENVTMIVGTILGFITLLPVLEYRYYLWVAKRKLNKLNKTFMSKKFQDVLNKIPDQDAERLRDSIRQFQKELSQHGKDRRRGA